MNGGLDSVRLPPGDPSCERITGPFGDDAGRVFPFPVISAFPVPRNQLLDPKLKRIEDSVTVEPLSGTDPFTEASASGTYPDQLSITLKRLKLKR